MREGMRVGEERREAHETDPTIGRGGEGEGRAVAPCTRVRLGSFWFSVEVLRELHWRFQKLMVNGFSSSFVL